MPAPELEDGALGLALAGRGFRAALFGLGTLWRINDLGWLGKIDRIASTSGGSIAAACLGVRWNDLIFDSTGVALNFRLQVADPLRQFCARQFDVRAFLAGVLNPSSSISQQAASKFERELFLLPGGRPATLQDLPSSGEGPEIIIYTTSLNTGEEVKLSRRCLADRHLGGLMNPVIRLALAVTASCGFPSILSPVRVWTDPSDWITRRGSSTALRRCVTLSGVSYNTGINDMVVNVFREETWKPCATLLVCDADAGIGIGRIPSPWKLRSWTYQTIHVLKLMRKRTAEIRREQVVSKFVSGSTRGSLWGIGTPIDDFELDDAMTRNNTTTYALKEYSTRFRPFSLEQQDKLINWGYALADAAIRSRLAPGFSKGV